MAAKKEPMVKIEYVGPKAWAIDNVCDTTTAWEGTGDIQEVPESVAEKLILHPTEFAIYDPAAKKAKAEAEAKTAADHETAIKSAQDLLDSANTSSEAAIADAAAKKAAFEAAVVAYQAAASEGKGKKVVADLEAAAAAAETVSIEADALVVALTAQVDAATAALAAL